MIHFVNNTNQNRIPIAIVTSFLAINAVVTGVDSAIAQVVGDGTLPVPTRVAPNGNTFTITDGTQVGGNLFHSFSQFSIPTGGAADFNTTQYSGIQNIFSRITGGAVSNIDGVIRASGIANLFLLNPSGIVFGPNASLDVGGSFLATTGNSIRFADGSEFSANAQAPAVLTVSVPIGVQFGSNPGSIQVNGSDLQTPGKTIGLLGGDIRVEGGERGLDGDFVVTAVGGRIELGSVAENSFVNLNFVDNGFTLGYAQVQAFQDIQLLNNAFLYADNGGSMQVQGRNVQLAGGSQIGTVNEENLLPGGTVTINASESLDVSGVGTDPSLILNRTASSRDAGVLTINTKRLTVKDGGQISTSTNRPSQGGVSGRGGNLIINASQSVEVGGISPISGAFTGLSVQSNLNANGNGGSLLINTNLLSVTEGGRITAATLSNGQGGNLTVNAATIQLTGGSNSLVTGLIAEAGTSRAVNNPNTRGQGGNLTINTGKLIVQDGARVSTGTYTAGNAGNLVVNASDSVQVVGRSRIDQSPSLISASSVRTGAAGDLSIASKQVTVRDGGAIAVSASGTGTAGELQITSPFILLDNRGVLTAETRAGQGDITLRTSDLRLRRNSLISTNATGTAPGGNINITTTTLVALENSDITANSQESFGGRVSIAAGALFGTAYRTQLTPQSDITATSALGPQFSGLVTIQTPSIDPSQGLVELQTDVVDVSRLVVAACSPESQQVSGEFFITGRGGLPPSPGEGSVDDQVLVDLGKPLDARSSPSSSLPPGVDHSTRSTPRLLASPLLQAQGWMVNTQGKVVLVAQTPTSPLPMMTGLIMPPCNNP